MSDRQVSKGPLDLKTAYSKKPNRINEHQTFYLKNHNKEPNFITQFVINVYENALHYGHRPACCVVCIYAHLIFKVC